MRGKKKSAAEPPKPKAAPERLARPFASALADFSLQKPEPPAPAAKPEASRAAPPRPSAPAKTKPAKQTPLAHHGYDDRVAFQQAFADVRPLGPTKRGAPRAAAGVKSPAVARVEEADAAARARLDTLVAESVRFVISRELDGAVAARRVEVAERALDQLYEAAPSARLDLHGKDRVEARRALLRFLREQQGRAPRDVLVIHGKGLHADGGPVLMDAVEETLTTTSAAGRVLAFVTAPERHGGLGALLVRLAAGG